MSVTDTAPPDSQASRKAPESDLEQVRSLLENGDHQSAAETARQLDERFPDDPDVLYLLAAARRYAGALEGALDAGRRLATLRPEYGRAFQEQGHTLTARGNHRGAVRAYRQAVQYNPALHASWRGLAAALDKEGDPRGAERAREQFQHLRQQPPELLSVANMLHEGRLYKAEKLCRHFLQRHRHHPEAMRLLALLGMELGVLDDADFVLESCLELYPDFHQARLDYIRVLQKRQKFSRALAQARTLLDKQPDNPQVRLAYANACAAAGRNLEALEHYDAMLAEDPTLFNLHLARGHALKTVGRSDEARDAYRAACRARPDFGDAWWSLANLKTYAFDDREVAQMETAERAAETAFVDRYHLCFALGKAWEERDDVARSFHYYQSGNALKRQQSRYSAERNERDTRLQIRHCTPELCASKANQGHPAPDPIFIVGLPRAGSTLLEQILASHSQVEGTMELPNIPALAHRLDGRRRVDEEPRYPANLHELDAERLYRLGRAYLDDTRMHRSALFLPNNFRHLGLIHLILPHAKIIDARRHPMACCFSGFQQLFAEGQEFTYDLRDIGYYYRHYVELMDHWDRVLPGKVLRVYHEDVVNDLEGQVRRLLDFCGLPFERACLEFHRTHRAVRTASSEQVRRPINREGLARWHRFRQFLGPLEEALGPALRDYPRDEN